MIQSTRIPGVNARMRHLRTGHQTWLSCQRKEAKMVAKKLLLVYGLLKNVEFHQASGIIEVSLKINISAKYLDYHLSKFTTSGVVLQHLNVTYVLPSFGALV